MKISCCTRERCKNYFRSDNCKARSAAACRGMLEGFDRNNNRYFLLLLSKWNTTYGKFFILFPVTLYGVLNTIIFFTSCDLQRTSTNACFISIQFQFHICSRASGVTPGVLVERKLIVCICKKCQKKKTFWNHLIRYLYVFLRFFILIRTHIQMYLSLVLFHCYWKFNSCLYLWRQGCVELFCFKYFSNLGKLKNYFQIRTILIKNSSP